MAKTEYIFFSGKCKWARVYKPNQWDKWSIDVYLSNDDAERFRSLKVKTHLRKDDDGYYVSFSRPIKRTIRGKDLLLPPPAVIDNRDQPLYDTAIGNGSDVTVKLEYYSYKPPLKAEREYAIRLFGVRVDNLVPYGDESRTPEENKAVGDLIAQPKPAW
jgi:hypothetical protein